MSHLDRITFDPQQCGGRPCIRGHRLRVKDVLDLLAAGESEKEILAEWNNDAFGNSIAIGTSSVHNAISHLKIVIVDGVYTVKGSTNWSLSGEQQQDNELSLNRNAVIAAETRAILDLNHDFMLKQMVGTKLDVTKLLSPTASGAMPPLPPSPQ